MNRTTSPMPRFQHLALATFSSLPVADFLHRRDDPVDAGHHRFFEVVVERDGDLVAVDVLDRGVEVVEAGLLELVEDAAAHAAVAPVFVDDHAAVGLLDAD